MREKSKDIVALLTDDNLLDTARRNRNPPLQRRPSSTGPLTIEGRGKPSHRSSEEGVGRSCPGRTTRSFGDLQDVDEDAALAMALQQSKEEYEHTRELLEHGYDVFAERRDNPS